MIWDIRALLYSEQIRKWTYGMQRIELIFGATERKLW